MERHRCDLVMKGGITSGVVFPRAIEVLSQHYEFRNLAGTSAGAIAAVAAAAAELGRRSGSPNAFAKLGELSDWLGDKSRRTKKTNLLQLFQPTPAARPAFELATLWINKKKSMAGKVAGTVWQLFLKPGRAWLGLLPGLLTIGALLWAGGSDAGTGLLWALGLGLVADIVGLVVFAVAAVLLRRVALAGMLALVAFVAVVLVGHSATFLPIPDAARPWVLPGLVSIMLALVGLVSSGLLAFVRRLTTALPTQFFGMCPGMEQPSGDGDPALTTWMHQRVQDLADRKEGDAPVTFGDLEGDEPENKLEAINLRTMTTCLTLGRPYLLPFDRKDLFFDPQEFARLVPPAVLEHLERKGRERAADPDESLRFRAICRAMHPRLPLPQAGDLPILLAARMSLSFPFLLAAVPLWSIDWRDDGNQEASSAWRKWAEEQSQEVQEKIHDPAYPLPPDAPKNSIVPEVLWFSDGGLSSNFPIHLFDQLIPKWPTFAINLRYRETEVPEEERVTMAQTHSDEKTSVWKRLALAGDESPGTIFGFVGALIDAMKDWVDNTAMTVPGYLDRIAHVNLGPGEGGLNLEMSPPQIKTLVERGEIAAEMLRERFQKQDATDAELSWDNHRWTRLRSTLSVLQDKLENMREAFLHVGPESSVTWEQLIFRRKDQAPTSYKWSRRGQAEAAKLAIDKIGELLDEIQAHDVDGFRDRDIPKPKPDLQLRPPL